MKNLGDDDVTHMYYEKHDFVVGHLEDVDTWICEKHCPVVKNLGHNDVVHVDYEKHDPIVRNLEDDKAKHVN